MEAVSTSETSVNFYETTRLSNPEGCHLHEVIIFCHCLGAVVALSSNLVFEQNGMFRMPVGRMKWIPKFHNFYFVVLVGIISIPRIFCLKMRDQHLCR
jgi:hypothetical protein